MLLHATALKLPCMSCWWPVTSAHYLVISVGCLSYTLMPPIITMEYAVCMYAVANSKFHHFLAISVDQLAEKTEFSIVYANDALLTVTAYSCWSITSRDDPSIHQLTKSCVPFLFCTQTSTWPQISRKNWYNHCILLPIPRHDLQSSSLCPYL